MGGPPVERRSRETRQGRVRASPRTGAGSTLPFRAGRGPLEHLCQNGALRPSPPERLRPASRILACKIASNRDPSKYSTMSLIKRANLQPRWGHGWTRNSTLRISNIYNKINALLDFPGGVNIGRDFTRHRDDLFDRSAAELGSPMVLTGIRSSPVTRHHPFRLEPVSRECEPVSTIPSPQF